MNKLLVAFDASTGSEVLMKDLKRAGLPTRIETKVITLADVWLPPIPASNEDMLPGTRKAASMTATYEKAAGLLCEAKRTSEHGAQILRELFPEWIVTSIHRTESPAWGIIGEARRWNADLIAIGSHGRNPLERVFLGSVSLKVAAEANCSVRVVRQQITSDSTPPHLLIAMDRSPESTRVVEEISKREWPPGTQVELVTVLDPKCTTFMSSPTGLLNHPDVFETFEYAIDRSLKEAREKLNGRNLDVKYHIFQFDAKHVLLRQAADWKIDCIFIGAHGVENGERRYLGTLATAMCTRAQCTVEIVR